MAGGPVPMIVPSHAEGAPGPSLLGTGDIDTMQAQTSTRQPGFPSPDFQIWESTNLNPSYDWRVAPVPMIVPSHAEGAPGPSLLGTGDVDTMQAQTSTRQPGAPSLDFQH